VLGIAPLIMVTLLTVSSFFSTCGCFLRVERSFSRMISLFFSLACGWSLGRMALFLANGGASSNLGLKDLWVQEKGGSNRPPEWARPDGLGRPAQTHLSPVRSRLHSRGSSCIYALCPLHLHHFDDVILASKMEVLLACSPVFYASILEYVPL
jgi:hypothetical protein